MRGQIFIEGRRLVSEALRSHVKINESFVAEDFEDETLIQGIADIGSDILQLPISLFRSIADTDHSQGVILLAERPREFIDITRWRSAGLPVFIFLHEVNNPSNLGAVLRTAEAAGAAGVFVSSNSADAFSPKALRSSMGSAFRLKVREGADLKSTIGEAREAGIR